MLVFQANTNLVYKPNILLTKAALKILSKRLDHTFKLLGVPWETLHNKIRILLLEAWHTYSLSNVAWIELVKCQPQQLISIYTLVFCILGKKHSLTTLPPEEDLSIKLKLVLINENGKTNLHGPGLDRCTLYQLGCWFICCFWIGWIELFVLLIAPCSLWDFIIAVLPGTIVPR